MCLCHPFSGIRSGGLISNVLSMAALAEAAAEGIRGYRARRRMSQKELGAAVGLHERTVSDIERGRRPLTIDGEVLAFCRALQCTLGDLLDAADTEDLRTLGLQR